MNGTIRKSMLIAAIAGLAQGSDGAVIGWNNAAGGSTGSAANWNPAVVPASTDTMFFGLPGTYTVTNSPTTPTSDTTNFANGNVTFVTTRTHGTDLCFVGTSSSPVTLNLTSGTFSARQCNVAVTVNNTATMNVTGPTAIFRQPVGGILRVGYGGNGTLNVTNGGRVLDVSSMTVGSDTNTTGIVTVSGAGSAVEIASAGVAQLTVGHLGSGTVSIVNGGNLDLQGLATLALMPGSTGTVNVSSSVAGVDSTFSLTHNLNIGRIDTPPGANAGTGLLVCGDGGTVTAAAATLVGDPDGGTGTLRIDGGSFTTQSISFAPGSGVLDFRDGMLTVNGGVFSSPTPTLQLAGATSADQSTLQLTGGASLSGVDVLLLGAPTSRRGELIVTTGSTANMTSALQIDQNGVAIATGAGARISAFDSMILGVTAGGTLHLFGGAQGATGTVLLAPNIGSVGVFLVESIGTRHDCERLFVGGNASGTAGGQARFDVSEGAVGAIANSGANPVIVYPQGRLRALTQGQITVSNDVTLQGLLELVDGRISARQINAASGGSISGSGLIDSAINGNFGSGDMILTGPLEVGKSVGNSTFTWREDLNVGAHALTVRVNLSDARLGDVALDGGSVSLIASSGQKLSLASGDSLRGTGTINGPITISPSGAVDATGSSGLTFTGMVTPSAAGNFVTMTGTRVHFNGPASGFNGSGTINTQVVTTNATVAANGPLVLGNGTANCIQFSGGTLDVGAHAVALNAPGTTRAPGLTDIRGGSISAPTYELQSATSVQLLRGFGTISGNLRSTERIAPEGAVGDPTGRISVTGALTLLSGTSQLECDIDAGDYDIMFVGGNVTLDGTLTVQFVNGFVPTRGDSWPILRSQSGGIIGSFDVANLPPGCTLVQTSDTLAVYFPCLSDIDADGDVDSDDIVRFFLAWDQGEEGGDVDQDGDADSDDVIAFFQAFDSGC